MSKFTDALSRPLPSKLDDEYLESTSLEDVEDVDTDAEDTTSQEECAGGNCPQPGQEGCSGSVCEDDEEVGTDDVSDLSDDSDDFDPDDMSDEELAALDAELSDQAVNNVVGDEAEVDLSPDEEIQADDMMSVAATTMLVNDELNAEEKVEFAQNHGEIAVNEGFMTETDVNELAMESGLVQEAKYNQKMIIRLDAKSKQKQLYALAVNVSAAAHHDPDYYKLKKVMKMRKILRAKLERKYHPEATKRMKIYFARLKKSKSSVLSKIGHKYSK